MQQRPGAGVGAISCHCYFLKSQPARAVRLHLMKDNLKKFLLRDGAPGLAIRLLNRVSRTTAILGLVTGCLESESLELNRTRRVDPSPLTIRTLYADLEAKTPAAGAIEYTPDYALWSDGVQKRRWLILPENAPIDTADIEHWEFPVGTLLVKEFSLDGVRLETRVIQRTGSSGVTKRDFFMGTFLWSEDQLDAALIKDGAFNVGGTAHDVPAQKVCITCHAGEPSAVLGLSAVQASRSGLLDELSARELLSEPPGRTFLIPGDELQSQALGILHANCGHCHSSSGLASTMRLRFLSAEADLPFEQTELYRTTVGKPISDEWLAPAPGYSRRIVAGHPESSAVAFRMGRRGEEDEMTPDQMPPLATEKVDEQGLAVVNAWIASLPEQPTPTWDQSLSARPSLPASLEREARRTTTPAPHAVVVEH